MKYSVSLAKTLTLLRLIYNCCAITKKVGTFQTIVPLYYINKYVPHLAFNKYLYLPLTNELWNEYNNFRFTIYPEPMTIFYENLNGKIIKGGIFNAIDLNGNQTNLVLLYNSRVFLKWHFLKFLEVNRIEPSKYNYQFKYMNSDLYLNEVIYNISKIDYENIYDNSGDNIMV
jgi:hypothetical protein